MRSEIHVVAANSASRNNAGVREDMSLYCIEPRYPDMIHGYDNIKPEQEIARARTRLVSQQCRSVAQHASLHILGFDTKPSGVVLKTSDGNRFRLISVVKPMISVVGVDFEFCSERTSRYDDIQTLFI